MKNSNLVQLGDIRRMGIMRNLLKRQDPNWLASLRRLLLDHNSGPEWSVAGRSRYECPNCAGRTFLTRNALNRHLTTHSVPLEERQQYRWGTTFYKIRKIVLFL